MAPIWPSVCWCAVKKLLLHCTYWLLFICSVLSMAVNLIERFNIITFIVCATCLPIRSCHQNSCRPEIGSDWILLMWETLWLDLQVAVIGYREPLSCKYPVSVILRLLQLSAMSALLAGRPTDQSQKSTAEHRHLYSAFTSSYSSMAVVKHGTV